LVSGVEGALQIRIAVLREEHSREAELSLVAQRALIFRDADLDLEVAEVTEGQVARSLGVVERVAGRQSNHDAVLLGPRVVEIDVVLALAGREERADALLKEARLQEEPLARALGVAVHAHFVGDDEWLERVSYVLELDLGHLGVADPFGQGRLRPL